MTRPAELRKLSRDELAYGNVLCQWREPLVLPWLDEDCEVRLTPAQRLDEASIDVEVEWSGERLVVEVGHASVAAIVERVLQAPLAPDTPEPLIACALEAALARACDALEARFGRIRIVRVGAGVERTERAVAMGWTAACGTDACTGRLWLDLGSLALLASALEGVDAVPGDGALHALAVPLRFEVGWVVLRPAEISGLGVGDVLLLDGCWLRDDELTVRVGARNAFRGSLRGTQLEVKGWVAKLMSDTLESEFHEQPDDLDELPVRLTFDLGERSIPLSELRSIAPGYTFDLGRDLRRSVTIRANGMPFGEGELVDVDGHIGVAIRTTRAGRA